MWATKNQVSMEVYGNGDAADFELFVAGVRLKEEATGRMLLTREDLGPGEVDGAHRGHRARLVFMIPVGDKS